MKSNIRTLALVLALSVAARAVAQTPAQDPSDRLKEVLPPDVAARVLAKIADARAHQLPAEALENRALKFASRGVPAADIEKSVSEHADRLSKAKDALEAARGKEPQADEIEAGAEALREGVDGKAVADVAKTAPRDRSMTVPLYVLGQLVGKGIASQTALDHVKAALAARSSDEELEKLPAQAIAGQANRPAETGRDLAGTKSGGRAGGPPAGVPVSGAGRPGSAGRPSTVGHRP
jgi:hypothetical protein